MKLSLIKIFYCFFVEIGEQNERNHEKMSQTAAESPPDVVLNGNDLSSVSPVPDFSSIRSKTVLISPTEEQYDLLLKKLQSLIDDSRGETIYEIGMGHEEDSGLEPEEYDASLATLQSLAASLNADCVELRTRKGEKGMTGQYLVRQRLDEQDFMEIRVAVVGNVDAGKSTLLGVLTHGELDNGRGHSRQRLFRHKHEMESGRTSSVGNDILGFDSTGNVVNKPDHGHLDWVKICEKSSKVITFIDLAGHERYLKTTVFGMTGHAPDFGMLMVRRLFFSVNDHLKPIIDHFKPIIHHFKSAINENFQF